MSSDNELDESQLPTSLSFLDGLDDFIAEQEEAQPSESTYQEIEDKMMSSYDKMISSYLAKPSDFFQDSGRLYY